MKNTNKYPDKSLLRENTIIGFEDCLLEQLDTLILNICRDYNIVVPKYNKEILYSNIVAYYEWIIPILSEKGVVSNKEVYEEIDSLVEEYNSKINKEG